MCGNLGIVTSKNQEDLGLHLGLLEVLSSSLALWGGLFPFLLIPECASPGLPPLCPGVPELSLMEVSPLWVSLEPRPPSTAPRSVPSCSSLGVP